MTEENHESLTTCPKCDVSLNPAWSVCPVCGLRIKPENGLALRAALWGGVLVGYVLMVLAVIRTDRTLAIGFGVVVGVPLAYVFGRAVIFRLSGRPLTLGQLGRATLRAAIVTILTVVVGPLVLGTACLLLLFAICATGAAFH